jgi:hypothetical protein
VPKNLSDFTHACARAKHRRGEAVSQHVGTLKDRMQACSIECAPNDRRHRRRSSKTRARRFHANKHPTRFARGTIHAQIGCERLTDIHRQGHPVVQQTLTANEDLAGPPVEVIELESNDFPSTETEAGEQEKDGVIAAAGRCLTVTATEHTVDFIRKKVFRHSG